MRRCRQGIGEVTRDWAAPRGEQQWEAATSAGLEAVEGEWTPKPKESGVW